ASGSANNWAAAAAAVTALTASGGQATTVSLNSLLGACESAAAWASAVAALSTASSDGLRCDAISLNSVASAAADEEQGDWRRARSMLKDYQDLGLQRSIVSFGSAIGPWATAIALLIAAAAAHVRRSAIAQRAALAAAAAEGQWRATLELLPGARDVRGFSSAVDAAAKAMLWKLSFGLLASMAVAQVQSSVIAYHACIGSCEKAGQWAAVLQLEFWAQAMTEAFRQQCLLLAWANIESAACEDGAASSLCWERNEITHAMEAGTSLEQVLSKAEDFPRLSQKFLELQGSNPTSLDVDLVDALVFIRLLALLREHFYKMQDGAGAFEPVGFDIRVAVRRLADETGVHLGRAKSINRLRNAFKHQTAKRYGLGGKQANQIAKTMTDLSPDTLEDFSMLASELAGIPVSLDELLEDYATESGQAFDVASDPDLNLGQFLHTLHVRFFKMRGAPRSQRLEEVQQNVYRILPLCNGSLLALHQLLGPSLSYLPDIGAIVTESLGRLECKVDPAKSRGTTEKGSHVHKALGGVSRMSPYLFYCLKAAIFAAGLPLNRITINAAVAAREKGALPGELPGSRLCCFARSSRAGRKRGQWVWGQHLLVRPFPGARIMVALDNSGDELPMVKSSREAQELLAEGMVVEFDDTKWNAMLLRLVLHNMFVSHQWAGVGHPDPHMEQFKVLQQALKNVLSGKTAIHANINIELYVGQRQAMTAEALAANFDWVKEPVGEGYFTVEKDRLRIAPVLEAMLRNKISSYLDKKDYHNYRLMLNLQNRFFTGLPMKPAYDFIPGFQSEAKDPAEYLVAQFMHQNCFTGLLDRNENGWTPLCYAALSGDPLLVYSLLQEKAGLNSLRV
ncbi:Invs, partial [Symbiodinium sp. KB8]